MLSQERVPADTSEAVWLTAPTFRLSVPEREGRVIALNAVRALRTGNPPRTEAHPAGTPPPSESWRITGGEGPATTPKKGKVMADISTFIQCNVHYPSDCSIEFFLSDLPALRQLVALGAGLPTEVLGGRDLMLRADAPDCLARLRLADLDRPALAAFKKDCLLIDPDTSRNFAAYMLAEAVEGISGELQKANAEHTGGQDKPHA